MPAGSARLFVALWPGPRLRKALANWCQGCRWPDAARPTAAAQWHLTLHFLGAVPRADLPALRAALHLDCDAFTLSLGRPALWHGGIAVLEPDAAPPRLLALHAALGEVLCGLGRSVETRPYRPHLTLARHAQHATLPAAGPGLRWPVRGYALVESGPPPHGYRLLQRYPCAVRGLADIKAGTAAIG